MTQDEMTTALEDLQFPRKELTVWEINFLTSIRDKTVDKLASAQESILWDLWQLKGGALA